MKLTIIAATGGVGRQLLRQAPDAGHDVTAVARNPANFPQDVLAGMESRPWDGPPRLPRSAPPPGHRLHPRYGESAAQVSSQCDGRTNERPDLKLAAQQMPSRNRTHNAETVFMGPWLRMSALARRSPGSGGLTRAMPTSC